MPRDRKPQFKQQVRIKGRAVGIPQDVPKEDFMYFHNLKRESFKQGYFLGFLDTPNCASRKAAARADGLISKTDSEHYELHKKHKTQQVGKHKGDC